MDERDGGHIGDTIRKRRQTLALTQEAAAERAGMSAEGFARIERGHRTPTLESLVAISRALGASPNELLRWDAPDDPVDAADGLRRMAASRLGDLGEDDLRFVVSVIDYVARR